MNWQIKCGEQSVIGVLGAAEIVVNRLDYINEQQSPHVRQRMVAEALQYARLLKQWIKENRPEPRSKQTGGEYVGCRPGGKPGPMSDG